MPTLVRLGVIMVVTIIAASVSAKMQRLGPDQGIYCDIGKINGIDVYCPKPKLNGGWPAPFLFDKPGISVEGKLSIAEDDFRPWPFLATASFYLMLFYTLERLWNRVRRRRT